MADDRGVAFGSGEESSGSRVGMIEMVGYNDNLLAGTTSPEENEENEENERNDEDWELVVAVISVDGSDVSEKDE